MSHEAPLLLLIEDDAFLGESLVQILVSEGYHVRLADHGERALSFFEDPSFNPALTLVDLQMPVMDGVTFLRELCEKHPARIGFPVLLMTAARELNPAGGLNYPVIFKPFDLDLLIQKIQNLIFHGTLSFEKR